MITRILPSFLGLLAASSIGFAASAQTATRTDAKTDWSIFVEDTSPSGKKMCWLASAPQSVENTRGGQKVTVDRGEIALFVLYVPADNIKGQVSFSSGYPYGSNSEVSMRIGSAEYTLLAEDSSAWSQEDDDTKIHTSMKRGVTAVVSGRSGRGTDTKDTFSLKGFTAALEQIEKLCGS